MQTNFYFFAYINFTLTQFGNKYTIINEINQDTLDDISDYYHRIYNRLKGKEQDEFKNGYDNLKEKLNNKEISKEELLKYLIKCDKKYRESKKGKRGRPYKNDYIY